MVLSCNVLGSSGEAIYLTGSLKLVDCRVTNNRAGEDGVAIASVCASSWAEFEDVYFAHNYMYCPSGQYQPNENGVRRIYHLQRNL